MEDIICKCGRKMPLKIIEGPNGYYIGHECPHCGPYDRVSDYYKDGWEVMRDFFIMMMSGSVPVEPGKICKICKGSIKGFKDKVSEAEYEISGMCQECQDIFFNKKFK